MSTFLYLGRTIVFNNSNWASLCQNLRKAQRHWGMVPGVMVKAGKTVRAREVFYKSVVQAVLICGSEIWFIADTMMKVMEVFHHRITWIIRDNTARQIGIEGW